MPPPGGVESSQWVGEAVREFALPAIIGSGGLVAGIRQWLKRRRIRQRREIAQGVAVRKLLDASRYWLFLETQPNGRVHAASSDSRLWSLRVDIDNVREELWLSYGNASKRTRRDG